VHKAAAAGYCKVLELLIQYGGNIDTHSKRDGGTPMHRAASAGRVEAIATLLDAGANVAAVDNVGRTPLHWAGWHAHDLVVKSLLEAGADITTQDIHGRTVVNIATWRGHDKTVRELLHGTGNDGRTALLRAASEGQLSAVEILLHIGADVNQSNDGESAIHLAASGGYDTVVGALIQAKANPSQQSIDGATPLHRAAWRGYDGIVSILLNGGSSPWVRNNEGWTPLHHAAYAGHQKVMFLILQNAAKIGTEMEDADPLKCPSASQYNRGTDVVHLIELLLSRNPRDRILHRALGNEHLRQKQYSKARDAYDEAAEIAMQNDRVHDLDNLIHKGIHCDECSRLIQGKNYKCILCSWNFDLCEPCGLAHAHPSQDLIQIPSEFFCKLNFQQDLHFRAASPIHRLF
jgi:ankyrin repeat protein